MASFEKIMNSMKENHLRRLNKPIHIKDWRELESKIPQESETHKLVIKEYSGWLKVKPEHKIDYPMDNDVPFEERIKHMDIYLSTHSFYGNKHKHTTELLQQCGFNVICANWDELEGY